MNPIGWFEIYVDDLEACRAFYESVTDVTLTPNEMEWPGGLQMLMWPADYNGYGASGALCKMEGVNPGGNSTLVYFSCEDCAIPQAKIEPAGGRLVQSKFAIGPHGFIVIAQDPDGNTIGFHSMQ